MISKQNILFVAAGALAASMLAAPAVFAQQSAAPADRLSITQVDQRLSAQGFRVLEVEWDDDKFEVVAFNAQNQCRELDVHARTGAVLRDRADDDCYDDDRRRGDRR
ncbi:MAG TPA: PepSY domain-containing protein [Terricaulis sp.]|nr:PepSY domain-containing protein [Terricaulis sp.]